MDNQTICEAIKKHLSNVLGKSLSLRHSASLTSAEISAIIDLIDVEKDISHLEKKSAWFDVYASSSILMRCVISNGSLFIIKKAIGLDKKSGMGRSSDTPIEVFTLADPKSIEKATDSILNIINASLQAMLKKVEPLRTAVDRIKAYKEKCESH